MAANKYKKRHKCIIEISKPIYRQKRAAYQVFFVISEFIAVGAQLETTDNLVLS